MKETNLTLKEFFTKHDLGIVRLNNRFHRLKPQSQDSEFVALSAPTAVTIKPPMELQEARELEVRLELGGGLVLYLSQQ